MKQTSLMLLLAIAVATLLSCEKPQREQETKEKLAGRSNTQQLEEHIIPISQAREYARRFVYMRDTVLPGVLSQPGYLDGNFNIPICETFCRESIDELLAVEGTQSVRIYFGVDESGQVRLILLPVDDEGNNIYAKLSEESSKPYRQRGQNGDDDDDDGEGVENGHRPPPPPNGL